MGFLQGDAQAAANTPTPTDAAFNSAFGAGIMPSTTPPALDVTNPLDAPAATPSPGQPMDLSPTLAQATPDLSTAALGDAIPDNGNILSRLGRALGGDATMPGTGPGGRRSVLDIIGGLGDAFAQAGGAPVQYGPGVDARLARQQTATNNQYQNQFNQDALEKGHIDLANARNAQIAQVSAGLNSLYGDGSPENVAKVQAALPLFAKTMGIDPNSAQFQAFQQGMQTDPKGTMAAMTDALDKGKAATSGDVQFANYLKENAPELVQPYLNHKVNGMPLTEKDLASLQIQMGNLANNTKKTNAYVAEKTGKGGGGGGGGGTLSDEALNYAADQYRATGQIPPVGQGTAGAALRAQILQRAAERATGGGDAQNPGAFRAGFKANSASLQKLQSQVDQIQPNLRAAQDNAQQVLQALPTGAAGQSPIINRWIQAGRRSIQGDPEVTRFDTAIRTYAREYAKVISGATGGRAPTDTAQKHVDELINSSMNPSQIRSAIGQMHRDMDNVIGEQNNQIKSIQGRLKLPSGNGPAGATKTATGPNGAKAFLVGGRWVDANGKAL